MGRPANVSDLKLLFAEVRLAARRNHNASHGQAAESQTTCNTRLTATTQGLHPASYMSQVASIFTQAVPLTPPASGPAPPAAKQLPPPAALLPPHSFAHHDLESAALGPFAPNLLYAAGVGVVAIGVPVVAAPLPDEPPPPITAALPDQPSEGGASHASAPATADVDAQGAAEVAPCLAAGAAEACLAAGAAEACLAAGAAEAASSAGGAADGAQGDSGEAAGAAAAVVAVAAVEEQRGSAWHNLAKRWTVTSSGGGWQLPGGPGPEQAPPGAGLAASWFQFAQRVTSGGGWRSSGSAAGHGGAVGSAAPAEQEGPAGGAGDAGSVGRERGTAGSISGEAPAGQVSRSGSVSASVSAGGEEHLVVEVARSRHTSTGGGSADGGGRSAAGAEGGQDGAASCGIRRRCAALVQQLRCPGTAHGSLRRRFAGCVPGRLSRGEASEHQAEARPPRMPPALPAFAVRRNVFLGRAEEGAPTDALAEGAASAAAAAEELRQRTVGFWQLRDALLRSRACTGDLITWEQHADAHM